MMDIDDDGASNEVDRGIATLQSDHFDSGALIDEGCRILKMISVVN